MKSTMIAMIVVVVLAVGICTASFISVRNTIDDMETLRVRALEFARAGDNMGAMEELVKLANQWQKAVPLLEILTSHDDLHDVIKELVDAQICLESGDLDDCYRALAQLGEALAHIRDMEEIRLSNLY